MKNKTIFVDMDGTLCEWKADSSLEDLYKKSYFLNLKPHINLIKALKELLKEGYDIYIISAYFVDSNFALEEKQKWLDLHFPINYNNRIFVPYGTKKGKYCLRKNNILIDDYNNNLIEWPGKKIKALNGVNSPNTFLGTKINVFDNEKEIIKKIKILC